MLLLLAVAAAWGDCRVRVWCGRGWMLLKGFDWGCGVNRKPQHSRTHSLLIYHHIHTYIHIPSPRGMAQCRAVLRRPARAGEQEQQRRGGQGVSRYID